MRRATLLLLFLLILLPLGTATEIGEERLTFDLGEEQTVEVERTYEEITTDRVSFLVPSRYAPEQMVARDAIGRLECQVNTLPIGKEILCTPRTLTNYTVTFAFTGSFVEQVNGERRFSYVKRVLSPTRAVDVQVVLPEGYGVVDRADAITPTDGETRTEGRRIFVQWESSNVSLGDTVPYGVSYESLGVLESIIPDDLLVGVLLVLVVILAALAYYFRTHRAQPDTIAAIFPVLKEDEQDVLRFIIDNDGEVEQRAIVTGLPYSKAKISKMVSNLADRELIEKEKQGRVNVVTLSKAVGDIED